MKKTFIGTVISLNRKSKIHIIAIFTAMPKSPRVIIRKGKVMTLIIGFTKKLSKPNNLLFGKPVALPAARPKQSAMQNW